ncbi:MAG: hypothetical protein HYY18_05720 [Planctomycetes bacterium]|nr:hypothetical protein [Planctomycetota bacterium]
MAYDPRAFPTLAPKRPRQEAPASRPAPGTATGTITVDEAIVIRRREAVKRHRTRRQATFGAVLAVLLAAAGSWIWLATRPPETLPYKPRVLTKTDIGQWFMVMTELAKMKQSGAFAGMPGGPLAFAREQSEHPDTAWRASREAGADAEAFLITCDAIGGALLVEEADRKSEESVANSFSEAAGPSDLPEELRLEVEFGKKGRTLAPPKLSDHLSFRDKENYKLFQENREAIRQALDAVR